MVRGSIGSGGVVFKRIMKSLLRRAMRERKSSNIGRRRARSHNGRRREREKESDTQNQDARLMLIYLATSPPFVTQNVYPLFNNVYNTNLYCLPPDVYHRRLG